MSSSGICGARADVRTFWNWAGLVSFVTKGFQIWIMIIKVAYSADDGTHSHVGGHGPEEVSVSLIPVRVKACCGCACRLG